MSNQVIQDIIKNRAGGLRGISLNTIVRMAFQMARADECVTEVDVVDAINEVMATCSPFGGDMEGKKISFLSILICEDESEDFEHSPSFQEVLRLINDGYTEAANSNDDEAFRFNIQEICI